MEGPDRDTTTTLASSDKVFVNALVAGLVAVVGMFATGTADFAELAVIGSGMIVAGAVYLQKYHANLPFKAGWALGIPLVLAILRFVQTGEFDEAELQLAVQAILGAIATYVAKRKVLTSASVHPNVNPNR